MGPKKMRHTNRNTHMRTKEKKVVKIVRDQWMTLTGMLYALIS